MKKLIATALLGVGLLFPSVANAEVSNKDLFEARLFKEMGWSTFVMAGVAYECGTAVQPNMKNWLDFVHEWYVSNYKEDATHEDTRDWIISKTAIDYSYGIAAIEAVGCDGFNDYIIDNEDVTTFTGSLLNLYQPEGADLYGV